MLAAQETDHLHHQRQRCYLGAQEVHHLRLPPDLVCELDLLIVRSDIAKVTCLLGDLGWNPRLVRSNTTCPSVEYSAGEGYQPKAGHVILSPFGSSFIVTPKFFI